MNKRRKKRPESDLSGLAPNDLKSVAPDVLAEALRRDTIPPPAPRVSLESFGPESPSSKPPAPTSKAPASKMDFDDVEVAKEATRRSVAPPSAGKRPPTERPQALANRRASKRIMVTTVVGLHTDSNFFTGFSGDVSEGGIFVATHEMQLVGTNVDIKFQLPQGEEIVAGGHVAWVREPQGYDQDFQPGMGIKFDNLEDEDQDAIAHFARLRSPLFHES